MHEEVPQVERRGAAAWPWMSRPELHDAFDEALVEGLTHALRVFDADAGRRGDPR